VTEDEWSRHAKNDGTGTTADRVTFVLVEPRPWSANQLRKLGVSIKNEDPPPSNVPTFDEVIVWYNELASSVQQSIEEQDWTPLLDHRIPEITSRAKTIDTLREKLRRSPRMKLGSVQDLAGVRFEAQMTLDEQDAVANAIAGLFRHRPEPPCLKDIRAEPHSGYRAVHLWLQLEAPVEVQIRTHLQGEWANMYEAAGDYFGRHIRYGDLPEDADGRQIVMSLQSMSTDGISSLERYGQRKQTLRLELDETPVIGRWSLSRRRRRQFRERVSKKNMLNEMEQTYAELERSVRGQLSDIRKALTTATTGA
jgi:ppGpp synthetase/RelA/SpoT-type nucleotidyltranferase